MSTVKDASDSLKSALQTVEGVRLYQLGDSVDPPATVVGLPTLQWEAQCLGPTSARFPVYFVVSFNDRAEEKLFRFVEQVANAVDSMVDAVMVSATPAPFTAGGSDLPSYELRVEVAL